MDNKVINKKIFHARKKEKIAFILDQCKAKNVLDIGCLGQDFNFQSDAWLHGKIKTVADKIVGVDVVINLITEANSKGYNIIHFEKLEDIKELFDIVLMADVIEHVDNPVELLKTYSRFMKDDGVIIVTTPNAKRAFDFINILLSNKYWLHPEHTMWLCPFTMIEIIRRAELKVKDFYWLKDYQKNATIFSKAGIIGLFTKALYFRKSFSPNFMFIIGR